MSLLKFGNAIVDAIVVSDNTEQIQSLSVYTDILTVDNVFNLDLENNAYKNFTLEITDTVAKEIVLSNVPTRCRITLELIFTSLSAITWFSTVDWIGEAPTFSEGKTQKLSFYTIDGGINWREDSVDRIAEKASDILGGCISLDIPLNSFYANDTIAFAEETTIDWTTKKIVEVKLTHEINTSLVIFSWTIKNTNQLGVALKSLKEGSLSLANAVATVYYQN